MRLLFLGDVVGRSGRTAVCEKLPQLRERFAADFVIVNGENAAGGFGLTDKVCADLYEAGADVITTGNHVWDQRDILDYIDGDPHLLRPHNYPKDVPGTGIGTFEARNGARVTVINVMGRIFMAPLDDPFAAVETALAEHRLGETADVIVVDMHGEATSEKNAMGYFADGRASLVIGTHSHVPTSDNRILPGGTAYQTDAGMCGDYESIIGMDKDEPLFRFTRGLPDGRFEAASGEATVCGVVVDIDDKTGLAAAIEPVRVGGQLGESLPD
jgi:hypothetical protein